MERFQIGDFRLREFISHDTFYMPDRDGDSDVNMTGEKAVYFWKTGRPYACLCRKPHPQRGKDRH